MVAGMIPFLCLELPLTDGVYRFDPGTRGF